VKRVLVIIGISIVVISVIFVQFALNTEKDLKENQKYLNSYQYLTAATYYGDAWVLNFWNSDFSSTDQNMERIKKDGFNSIILVIPWGEFQPGISPIKYNEYAFDRLNYIIEKANSHGLNVVLRIGFVHDYYPEAELPIVERILHLNDVKVYNAWLDYVHQIYLNAKNHKNVILAFISWEHFWPIIDTAEALQNVEDRIELSHKIGFSDYLKSKYDLGYISKIYGYNISSWESVPTPLRNSTAFELFFEFYDEQLVEKYLKPAQKQYPNLSMEIRVDKDPIYNQNDIIKWYSHSSTYHITGSNYTTIYYAAYMGAPNNFDYQPANTILFLMKNILLNVNKYTNQNKIFVDQFIWFDNTPGFEKNTKINENQIESFLHKSCSYLKNYTDGYGVWTYRDYIENKVYNPTFSVGTIGWLTNGTTHLKENAIILEQDSSVSQKISKKGIIRDMGPNTTVNMTFFAKSETPTAEIGIEIGGKKFMKNITDSNSLYEFQLRTKGLDNANITFRALNGTTSISDVKLYNFIHKGDVYNTNWEPLRSLKPVQQLNKCLS